MQNEVQSLKHAMDGAAVLAAFISCANVLSMVVSFIAASLSAVWLGIRIYEYFKTKKIRE